MTDTETEVVKSRHLRSNNEERLFYWRQPICFERGYAATSVDAILAKVGDPSAAFTQNLETRKDCLPHWFPTTPVMRFQHLRSRMQVTEKILNSTC